MINRGSVAAADRNNLCVPSCNRAEEYTILILPHLVHRATPNLVARRGGSTNTACDLGKSSITMISIIPLHYNRSTMMRERLISCITCNLGAALKEACR